MKRAEPAAWIFGAVATLAAMLGWAIDPQHFHLAWIAALTTWWGWPLGSVALLLIHRLTGGAWGAALFPALRTGVMASFALPFAMLPIVFGLSIYPWAHKNLPLANRAWLNSPFWSARLAITLLLWLGLAVLTLRQRRESSVSAAIGLVVLAFTFTFAAIDVVLSLAPKFSSSVFGLIEGTAGVLFALAIAAVPASLTAPRAARADIGKLLLALTVLWAYLDFMQFLIVWQSNLPNEAAWYAPRTHGGWGVAFAALALVHFLLPLALLALPRVQHSRPGIAGVAVLLIAMEIVRGWWTVLPQSPQGVGWIDLACTLAFASTAAGWLLRTTRRAHV